MLALDCCTRPLATLSRAAAKAVSARIRNLGLAPVARDWAARAQLCERCPMRTIRDNVSYCGTPLLNDIRRVPAIHGCGCPTGAKARDPHEHCPLDASHAPASRIDDACNCKWCALRGFPGT
jgi:hypothetical protein